jgi:hypothetical protein
MRRLFVGIAILAMFSLSCGGGGGSSVAPSEVTLKFQALDGLELHYKANTNIDTNIEGQTRTWMSETKARVKVVDTEADGSVVRSLTYDDFTMGEISGTGTLAPNPRAEDFVGENLQLTLNAEGKIVDWKGLDGISMMTDEGNSYRDFLVQQMAEVFQPFPDHAVSVGSKWQRTVETMIPVGGGDLSNRIQIDYELNGFGRKSGRECARIKMKYVVSGSATGRRAGRFWITTTGDGTGEMWFDYNEGVLVEYDKKVTITRDYKYERAGEEDVATQTTSIAREFKMKLES